MKIKAFFSNIKNFLLCFLRGSCEFSIKKLLVFFFTGLVFYLAIFTDKAVVEYLVFIAGLLGLREYSKYNYRNSGGTPDNKG
jgi:hypothetical protein